MFYPGETVRCWLHGFGEIEVGGDHPVVRFLRGDRVRVDGKSLTNVPAWMFERRAANLHAIERWLDLRLYGRTNRPAPLAPRPRFDLEKAMRNSCRNIHVFESWPVEAEMDSCFADAEVVTGLPAGESALEAVHPIRVVATPRSDANVAV